MAKKRKYTTISLLTSIADEIDEIIKELGNWPSRGAFVREATLAKIKEEKHRIRKLREENQS